MPSPAKTIADLLVAGGVGTFGGTSGWGIYVGTMPDSPDTCIAIYDTGGKNANPRYLLNFPSVQVAVRGKQGGYVDAYTKCEQIRNILLGLPSQDIGTERWTAVNAIGDIARLGEDLNKHPRLSLNFALIIEPMSAVGTNRESL